MSVIITIFTWLWNHRRAITAWSSVLIGAVGVAWLTTYIFANIVDLTTGGFSSFVDHVVAYMDKGREYLDGWVTDTDVEWIDFIYRLSEVNYFVDCLIGFGVFFVSIVSANILGLALALFGHVLRYIFILYKARRAAQIAKLNQGL